MALPLTSRNIPRPLLCTGDHIDNRLAQRLVRCPHRGCRHVAPLLLYLAAECGGCPNCGDNLLDAAERVDATHDEYVTADLVAAQRLVVELVAALARGSAPAATGSIVQRIGRQLRCLRLPTIDWRGATTLAPSGSAS